MLKFQINILKELIESGDGLLILSPGLGGLEMLRQLILIYMKDLNLGISEKEDKGESSLKGLVFILGGEEEVLNRYLWDLDVPRIDSSILSDTRYFN